jgi:hypothetical protein
MSVVRKRIYAHPVFTMAAVLFSVLMRFRRNFDLMVFAILIILEVRIR